jgi:hypothetical protein
VVGEALAVEVLLLPFAMVVAVEQVEVIHVFRYRMLPYRFP